MLHASANNKLAETDLSDAIQLKWKIFITSFPKQNRIIVYSWTGNILPISVNLDEQNFSGLKGW